MLPENVAAALEALGREVAKSGLKPWAFEKQQVKSGSFWKGFKSEIKTAPGIDAPCHPC